MSNAATKTVNSVDMSAELCGVKLATPVIGASGTIGFGLDYAEYMDFARVGGICLKALTPEPRRGNDSPRIAETPSGILNSVGLQNPGIDAFLSDIYPRLSELDTVKIANVAGRTVEDYVTVVEKLAQTDIPLYEINVSCPNVKVGGVTFGTDELALANLVSEVKKAASRPIIVKLTPNVTDIVKMAKVAEDNGADAVCLINTLLGMAIDLKTKKPILANITGGLSGPAVKPVALRMVWQVAQAVRIPVVGAGGITSGRDAAEFMLAGATAVEAGTATLRDPEALAMIGEELKVFCEDEEIQSVRELTGSLIIDRK